MENQKTKKTKKTMLMKPFVQVLPGDELILTCSYDSSDRENSMEKTAAAKPLSLSLSLSSVSLSPSSSFLFTPRAIVLRHESRSLTRVQTSHCNKGNLFHSVHVVRHHGLFLSPVWFSKLSRSQYWIHLAFRIGCDFNLYQKLENNSNLQPQAENLCWRNCCIFTRNFGTNNNQQQRRSPVSRPPMKCANLSLATTRRTRRCASASRCPTQSSGRAVLCSCAWERRR